MNTVSVILSTSVNWLKISVIGVGGEERGREGGRGEREGRGREREGRGRRERGREKGEKGE